MGRGADELLWGTNPPSPRHAGTAEQRKLLALEPYERLWRIGELYEEELVLIAAERLLESDYCDDDPDQLRFALSDPGVEVISKFPDGPDQLRMRVWVEVSTATEGAFFDGNYIEIAPGEVTFDFLDWLERLKS